MIRFRHYGNSDSLGAKYVFGLNIYKDSTNKPTIDLIVGKRVFVAYWLKR